MCYGRLLKYWHGFKGSMAFNSEKKGVKRLNQKLLDPFSRLSRVGEKRCRGSWVGTPYNFVVYMAYSHYAPHYYYYCYDYCYYHHHHHYSSSPNLFPTLLLLCGAASEAMRGTQGIDQCRVKLSAAGGR